VAGASAPTSSALGMGSMATAQRSASGAQADLFNPEQRAPAGFVYFPGALAKPESDGLVHRFEALPLKPFEFHGHLGNRRVAYFGWRYDYAGHALRESDSIPEFLLPLRATAAKLSALPPESLEQVLVTQYAPGAGIGWHRDRPMFEDVVAFSFGSPCTLRFRRKLGARWERSSVTAEPSSAYVLRGPARREWEHSIPPVAALRYSVTFRNFSETRSG
jgi:alkylated DNA repair dioxygenase AlkB